MRSLASLGIVCLLLIACKSGGESKPDDAAMAATDATGGSNKLDTSAGGNGDVAVAGQDSGTKDTAPAADADHTIGATKTVVYVTGGDAYIRILDFDRETGALSTTSRKSPPLNSPGFLAWDAQHKYLYALGGTPTKVVAFSINATDGSLTKINEASTGMGDGPPHLTVHPTGKWVLVAYYGSGHVTVHPVMNDGGVGEPVDTQRPSMGTTHSINLDASGKFAFAPCVDPNYVAQYKLDGTTGKLTPNTPATVAPGMPGLGPRHMAFHPAGKFAYTINESSGTMTAYSFDGTSGLLTPIETVSTVPAGVMEKACAHVLVHPTGKFVYGSNRNHNSIVIFSVDQNTGRLTTVADETGGGMVFSPRHFAIDPGGKFLLVANQLPNKNTILVFEIDGNTGKLTMKGKGDAPPGAEFVGVLP